MFACSRVRVFACSRVRRYRAFFGRFTRNAHGIPTWGFAQHGHGAMTTWSPAGWLVQLGAGWPFGWSGSRSGQSIFCSQLTGAHAIFKVPNYHLPVKTTIPYPVCDAMRRNVTQCDAIETKRETKRDAGAHLDLGRAPYVLYGVKYIDPVSPSPFSGRVRRSVTLQ